MTIRSIILATALLLISQGAPAQVLMSFSGDTHATGDDTYKTYYSPIGYDIETGRPAVAWIDPTSTDSPYRTSWTRDGMILGLAGIGVAMGSRMETAQATLSAEELLKMRRDAVPWFDRSATYRYSTHQIDRSELVGTALVVAPLALLLDGQMRSDWQTLGLMYVQTTMLAGATSTIAKESIPRYRPYIYNVDLTYEERTAREPGKAFFSSAATYAFSRAVFISTVFSDHHPDSALRPYVWSATLAAAGTTSYLRYSSGIHYPSDVVVGALVGSAIGYAVPRLHRMGTDNMSIVPSASHNGVGFYAHITF